MRSFVWVQVVEDVLLMGEAMSGRRRLGRTTFLAVFLLVSCGVSLGRQIDAISEIVFTPVDNIGWGVGSDSFESISLADLGFEVIGRQFAEPVDTLSSLNKPVETESPALLPAVPAAISLGLCGFLCVSFVRDRRSWLGVMCVFLWLGKVGILAVPHLGHKLCSRMGGGVHSTGKLNPAQDLNSFEGTGNYDSIRYIGLLRSLEGIPCESRKIIFNSRNFFARSLGHAPVSQAAVAVLCDLYNEVMRSSAGATGDFVCFSPAFIFSNLSRGPPPLEMRIFVT